MAKKDKRGHLFSDTIIGIVLTLVILIIYFFPVSLFESFEFKLYDFRAKLRQRKEMVKEIVIVGIDDTSIENVGRWPWSRTIIAGLIDRISYAQPRVIGLNIIYSEPDQNAGLLEVQELRNKYTTFTQLLRARSGSAVQNFLQELTDAETRLDHDTNLSVAISSATNVVLPMFFALGPSLTDETGDISVVVTSNTLTESQAVDIKKVDVLPEVNLPTVPLEIFGLPAAGVGHSNVIPDSDGVVRRINLLLRYNENKYYVPSFELQIARRALILPLDTLTFSPGEYIQVGKRNKILTDDHGAMLVDYVKPGSSFPYISAFDVLTDKIPADAFRSKTVLIGITATGIGDLQVTPVGHDIPGIEVIANAVYNILKNRFISRPGWAFLTELIILLLSGLYVILLLPRLKARAGAVITVILMLIPLVGGFYLFLAQGYWLKLFHPFFLLLLGYLILTSKHFFLTEKRKELVEAESIETNKMLGLSFQGQGMLDIAFEKFRKCPVDDAMKEILYNLGLDYERKRQYNKAIAVYDHIIKVDVKYKDLAARVKTLKAASEAVVISGTKKPEGTVVVPSGEGTLVQTPTLGRYEVAKELGHGAMGTVYLGKDPKINRTVAIKTLRFEDDVPEEQLKSVKDRFFREAESAGQLSHPNIIKIYDAGEDGDVSFIAMEYLEGEDLKKYTEKGNLLPINNVIDIIIKVADALDYAHQQGVVHRDIKPANIMLLKDGTIRVTDFGIARITASSKTQTGTVLGTPSYMSPEQVAGKKVDGRADIFSLGVTLFELLTGEKPFKGEGIAQLLYQITNEPHPDPKQFNPDIPDGYAVVLNKALVKDPELRYQRAGEMVTDLKVCLTNPGGVVANSVKSIPVSNTNTDSNLSPAEVESSSEKPLI